MKRFLSLTFGLLAFLLASAFDGLKVTPVSGDPVVFLFEKQPEASVLAGKLQIKTQGEAPVSFELDGVAAVEFVKSSAVRDIAAEAGIMFATDSEGAVFSNIPEGTAARVFTTAGRLALSRQVAGGEFRLRRSELSPGVYIVKINQFVTKITL